MKKDNTCGGSGFTLLELLVVVVIVTLMSVLVAPRMFGSLTHMNLKTEAKRLAAAMRYARSQAVTRQIDYEAVFDVEGRQVRIAAMETEGDSPVGADEPVEGDDDPEEAPAPLVYVLPEGITLQKSEAGEELFPEGALKIEFYPDGNSSGGEVILGNERGKRYIVWVSFISGTVGTDVCGEDCK